MLVDDDEAARIGEALDPAHRREPRKAGRIIVENLNDSSRVFFGWPFSSTSVFGLASSTLLTVRVIPAIYVALRDADRIVGGTEASKAEELRT